MCIAILRNKIFTEAKKHHLSYFEGKSLWTRHAPAAGSPDVAQSTLGLAVFTSFYRKW